MFTHCQLKMGPQQTVSPSLLTKDYLQGEQHFEQGFEHRKPLCSIKVQLMYMIIVDREMGFS